MSTRAEPRRQERDGDRGTGFIGSHPSTVSLWRLRTTSSWSTTCLGIGANLDADQRSFPSLRVHEHDASDYDAMREIVAIEETRVVFNVAVVPLPTHSSQPTGALTRTSASPPSPVSSCASGASTPDRLFILGGVRQGTLRSHGRRAPVRGRPCAHLPLPLLRRWLQTELRRFQPDLVHVLLFHAHVTVASLPRVGSGGARAHPHVRRRDTPGPTRPPASASTDGRDSAAIGSWPYRSRSRSFSSETMRIRHPGGVHPAGLGGRAAAWARQGRRSDDRLRCQGVQTCGTDGCRRSRDLGAAPEEEHDPPLCLDL